MGLGSVATEFATSNTVIVPSGDRRNPCLIPLLSWYHPVIEPESFIATAVVSTDPGGSYGRDCAIRSTNEPVGRCGIYVSATIEPPEIDADGIGVKCVRTIEDDNDGFRTGLATRQRDAQPHQNTEAKSCV